MTTVAEIRGIGPVFCTSAAVNTDATVYDWDVANHNDNNGAYYFEWIPDYPQVLSQDITSQITLRGHRNSLSVFSNSINRITSIGGGNTININGTLTEDIKHSFGAVYDTTDNERNINLDNAWATSDAYNGTWNTPDRIQVGFEPTRPWRIRELQRWDITSYAEGVSIINDLMGP